MGQDLQDMMQMALPGGVGQSGAPMISMQSQGENNTQMSQRSVNKQAMIGVNNAVLNDGEK